MNELQTEINELKEFIVDLKADRAATKEKEKREAWTKYVSLTVVIMAVIAAIATQWSGKYSGRVLTQLNNATFFQTQASDQWSYYEALSIKQKEYELACDTLSRQAATDPAAAALLKTYQSQIASYKDRQKDCQTKARDFEAKRDESRGIATASSSKGGKMGQAISLFSVAVAIASICLVTKKKPLWFMSLLLSAAAIYQMVRAFME
jgi:L-lactate permease